MHPEKMHTENMDSEKTNGSLRFEAVCALRNLDNPRLVHEPDYITDFAHCPAILYQGKPLRLFSRHGPQIDEIFTLDFEAYPLALQNLARRLTRLHRQAQRLRRISPRSHIKWSSEEASVHSGYKSHVQDLQRKGFIHHEYYFTITQLHLDVLLRIRGAALIELAYYIYMMEDGENRVHAVANLCRAFSNIEEHAQQSLISRAEHTKRVLRRTKVPVHLLDCLDQKKTYDVGYLWDYSIRCIPGAYPVWKCIEDKRNAGVGRPDRWFDRFPGAIGKWWAYCVFKSLVNIEYGYGVPAAVSTTGNEFQDRWLGFGKYAAASTTCESGSIKTFFDMSSLEFA